jgi:hypothetical protein
VTGYREELSRQVREHVRQRLAGAESYEQLNDFMHVDKATMDMLADRVRAGHPHWTAFRVLSADGPVVVRDWRSRRPTVVRHWRAVWACVRQGDDSFLPRFGSVHIGRQLLETDPARIRAAEVAGLLGLPAGNGDPVPWYPEAGR